MMNEKPERSIHMTNSRMDEDYLHFNSEAFIKELEADLMEDNNEPGFSSSRIPDVDAMSAGVQRSAVRHVSDQNEQCSSRPTLSNKSMLKGLIERTENFNKTVDRRVMTDARIAFEEEQLKNGSGQDTDEIEVLTLASQNAHKRGRGDYFGKLRSANLGAESSSFESSVHGIDDNTPPSESLSNISNNNNNGSLYNNGFFKPPKSLNFNYITPTDTPKDNTRFELSEEDKRSLDFKPPPNFGSRPIGTDNEKAPARHHFNPATAYNGKITPDYRFNYNPQAAYSYTNVAAPVKAVVGVLQPVQPPVSISSVRPGQRYPKRPDNNPLLPPAPKHLNHNYYNIELYGATQEERIAQRIEKTVRQTETPLKRF